MASHSKELRHSTVGEFLQTQAAIPQPVAQVTKHLHVRLDCPVRIPQLGQRPSITRRVNSQAPGHFNMWFRHHDPPSFPTPSGRQGSWSPPDYAENDGARPADGKLRVDRRRIITGAASWAI